MRTPHPSGSWKPLWLVAAISYIPFLVTRPGWVSADTKTYLYLDPSRLLSRAWEMWDPSVGLGTVSHQTIGYLWPMGPWFWAFDKLGVPDWVAQRLWWGTLLFAAISGVAYLLRRFEMPAVAIWPAALAFGLSPYAVAYLGRLSGVLLPAIGLPWLLAFTIMSIRTRGWRYPALFALVVCTVGSVNLTALALVGIAPAMWVVWAVVSRESSFRRVVTSVAQIGLLTTVTSLWWLSGLSVQATNGIDIVKYSESAEVVARTSVSFEVLRGLGYWFFYGGDKRQLWIEPSFQYTQRPVIFVITFIVPLLALASASLGKWRYRSFFAALLVVGTVVSVGAHPFDDPSPIGKVIKAFLGTERGLAFRSLPRAVPLIALASAVLIAGGIAYVAIRVPKIARPLAAVVVLASVIGMVPLWQRSIVQDSLSRKDEIPDYWKKTAALLDKRDDGTRVLEVPGSDFASYRWGNTVDPITPGLMDRPYVARELVPYGTPPSADFLNDFDLLMQERTLEPQAIAPIARLMRAGDIVVRGDLQYERYSLARPKLVWSLMKAAPGTGTPIEMTRPTPNDPDARLQMRDETWLTEESGLPDSPAVAIVPVKDVPKIVDAKPAAGAVLLSGDGAGIVNAATARLIDGSELIRYSASLKQAEVKAEVARGASLIVTDTNRERGERWGGLRHTRGYTERAGEKPLATSPTDNRLPRFPGSGDDAKTLTIQGGGVQADATSYGNPITFAADVRPALAIDGDPETAWATAAFSDARGEKLVLTLDKPLKLDHLVLYQLPEDTTQRALTKVRVDFGDGKPMDVDLGPQSRLNPGQRVDVGKRTTSKVTITLLADSLNNPIRYDDAGPVGFSEIKLGSNSPVITEVERMPTDLVDAVHHAGQGAATSAELTYLMTRLRQDPTDRTRGDEELALSRQFRVPAGRSFEVSGAARVSARTDDLTLDEVLGTTSDDVSVDSTRRLSGTRTDRASAALDGDPTTAWTGPYARVTDEHIIVSTSKPHTFDHMDMQIVADGRHSVPTDLIVKVDGKVVATPVLPAITDGTEPGHTVTVPIDLPATKGTALDVQVAKVREISSIDWTSSKPVDHPFAIAELGLKGLQVPKAPKAFDDRCRDDLITIDGKPVPVRINGTTAQAVEGDPMTVEPCSDQPIHLSAGDHKLEAVSGIESGIDIDRFVVTSPATKPVPAAAKADPQVTVTHAGRDHMQVKMSGLKAGEPTWLILAQSNTDGWTAKVAGGRDLGTPQLVDGYANGWLVHPTGSSEVVTLDFNPQKRVDLALGISAIGIVACLLLIIRRPRDRDEADVTLDLRRPFGGVPASVPVAIGTGVGILVASLLVLPLVAALPLAIAAGLAARHHRYRVAFSFIPAGLLGASVLYATALLVRYKIAPGIEWVGELERIHPIAMTGVVALGADIVIDVLWRRRQRRTSGPPEDALVAADLPAPVAEAAGS
ncbi:alpha-(1-_3)-arabinofuranosyltransferase domain-containing protein [Aquihabitans sp. McL0605]|uniref:alpha-(1->3)-arabinofuranosyltransferase domain-containing protein n=1 Tax=Aquihabitans sp. McL0605 TaxID=3415671 RepID=UPI003CF82E8D